MTRRVSAGAAGLLVALSVLVLPQPAAAADCQNGQPPPENATAVTTPWAQDRLAFRRAWPVTEGAGITVGVIGSGIDEAHPQLQGQVISNVTLLGGGDDATHDCVGHETFVAGIIAAAEVDGIAFVGVAPEAKLRGYKTTNQKDQDPLAAERTVDAIRQATDDGVSVINVSTTIFFNSKDSDLQDALDGAVSYAQSHDVLIVAAAGNNDQQATSAAYPANMDGVLSVSSVNEKGEISEFALTTTRIDIAAPGERIISTASGFTGDRDHQGYRTDQGTSFATPYVAGVAALVRAAHPDLTYRQVINRLETTADPLPDNTLGAGIVNPYQAVSAVLANENATGEQTPTAPPPIAQVAVPVPPDNHVRDLALILGGSGLALTIIVLYGGYVIPRGRKRRWRPERRPLPTDPTTPTQ